MDFIIPLWICNLWKKRGKKGLFQLVVVRIFSGLVLAVILFIRVLRLMLN